MYSSRISTFILTTVLLPGRYFNFSTVPSESFDYKEFWFTTYMDDFVVFQVKGIWFIISYTEDPKSVMEFCQGLYNNTTNNWKCQVISQDLLWWFVAAFANIVM